MQSDAHEETTMERIQVTPRQGKSFYKGVSAAKTLHGTFNAALKVWEVRADLVDRFKAANDTREEYLLKNHLIPAKSAPAIAATTYRGQASMDHEDSIF
jgi:hypothetical protein